MSERGATLYRFYDADDRLLYVGISLSVFQRWQQHSADKPWWQHVCRGVLEHFDTREAAAQAELCAIRDEDPLFNVIGRPRELSESAWDIYRSWMRHGVPLSPWARSILDRNPEWVTTAGLSLEELDCSFDLSAEPRGPLLEVVA